MPLWKEMEHYKEYQKKLRDYLGEKNADGILNEALYLISLGTNDFLENYNVIPGGRSSEFSIEEYQDFLGGIARNFVTELYQLGARKISLSGIPPMGCLPLERTTSLLSGSVCMEEYNDVAKEFNQKLQEVVGKLKNDLAGIHLVLTNPYDILLQMIQSPGSFGFEHVAVACCGTGSFEMSYLCNKRNPFTCSDVDKYVFWDSFHPTEKTNKIVAEHVVQNFLGEFL